MYIETRTMSENGRIVLPAAIRKASGVRPKETLTVRVDEAWTAHSVWKKLNVGVEIELV